METLIINNKAINTNDKDQIIIVNNEKNDYTMILILINISNSLCFNFHIVKTNVLNEIIDNNDINELDIIDVCEEHSCLNLLCSDNQYTHSETIDFETGITILKSLGFDVIREFPNNMLN